ncbi:SUN domain-containing-like protein [Schistosoma japonicum]|nr:SUN domain-containing-like protein [Schistosoma japonicum]
MFDIWKRLNSSTSSVEDIRNSRQPGVSSTKMRTYRSTWEEESTFEETLLETNRTDFTYGDSGSYRTDRLRDTWMSPNMSRLPLGSSS